MENAILFDWLTFSAPDMTLQKMIGFLGLADKSWKLNQPSRLHYEYRAVLDGISIHYTSPMYFESDNGKQRNRGCCVEMSGKGCRYFETYGTGDIYNILSEILAHTYQGWHCTRIDLAFDDFTGLIDLDHMARAAQDFCFTSRSQCREIIRSASAADPALDAITVIHGSKSSNLYIRCYDKRLERSRLDVPHWVRLEVQLRNDNCDGFITACQSRSTGEIFAGLLANYLQYRDPDYSDSNKSRWTVSDWWQQLLHGVGAIRLAQKRDVEYNAERLDHWLCQTMGAAIKTAIALHGDDGFLDAIKAVDKVLPQKYIDILEQANRNNADILKEIGAYDRKRA